jgi:hypothetical protein
MPYTQSHTVNIAVPYPPGVNTGQAHDGEGHRETITAKSSLSRTEALDALDEFAQSILLAIAEERAAT